MTQKLSKEENEMLLHYPADRSVRVTPIDRSGRSKDETDIRRRLVKKGLLEGTGYRRHFRLTEAGKKAARAYYNEITED